MPNIFDPGSFLSRLVSALGRYDPSLFDRRLFQSRVVSNPDYFRSHVVTAHHFGPLSLRHRVVSVPANFVPRSFRPRSISVRCRHEPGPFRPQVLSSPGRFGSRSFRHWVTSVYMYDLIRPGSFLPRCYNQRSYVNFGFV